MSTQAPTSWIRALPTATGAACTIASLRSLTTVLSVAATAVKTGGSAPLRRGHANTRTGSVPYRDHRPRHSSRRNEHGPQLPRLCDAAARVRARPAGRGSLGVGGSGPRRASRLGRFQQTAPLVVPDGRSRRGLHPLGGRWPRLGGSGGFLVLG